MALDPRIPLGVQPIQQQPNMLGQYAQIMAIKAAQQETEGYEGVKSAIAGGMDATDPRMLQYGKRGIDAFKAAGEGRVKQQDALTKAFVNARESLGMVRTPEDLLAYTVSQFNDPLIGPRLKAQGLTPEAAAANLQKELSTSGFETVLKKSAMGLDGWFKDQTSRYATNVAAGTAANRLGFDERKFKFEQENPGYEYKTLDNGGIAAVNKRTNEVTLLQTPGAAPTPPVNALTPTPAANLNSLINPPVVNQPGAPTIANAAALAPTPLRTAPRPGYQYNAQGQQVPITDPTKVVNTVTDKFGNVSMINAAGDVIRKVEGMGKPSAAVEKREAEIKALPATISQAKDALNLINRMVGTPDGKSKPHKGFEGAVGAGMGMRFIPGTSARDFQAMHEQITGGAFMQAFETLKGGGQITEKEGEKATAAITRMSLATSEKEYLVAAREFQEVIRRGIQNAEKELRSGGAISPANTGDIATDPAIKSLLDKYK
jgi:hypothetical protein